MLWKVLVFGVSVPLVVLTIVLAVMGWGQPSVSYLLLPVALVAILAAHMARRVKPAR